MSILSGFFSFKWCGCIIVKSYKYHHKNSNFNNIELMTTSSLDYTDDYRDVLLGNDPISDDLNAN